MQQPRRSPQSAAAPSPFPPIAEYAFLSNCHTGALIAADGAVDWLCVPSFDSPSIFGSLLDRQAGSFRLGPYGINHPTARTYVPGTNVLETTWKTPAGWIVVRDALTMGPTRGRDDGHAAHPAAGGRRRRPHARADRGVHRGPRRGRADLRACVRLRARRLATWSLVGDDLHTADATGAGQTRPARVPTCCSASKATVSGRVTCSSRASGCTAPCPGPRSSPCRPTSTRPRSASAATSRFWRAWLGRARIPDHRWRDPIQRSALAIKGLTYMPTGATVAALTTSLPETPGGERNWDYRYTWMRDTHVHAAGAALAQPRLGGRRVHAVRRRHRTDR